MSVTALPSLLYLWDRRTCFLGRLQGNLCLSQAAATLLVALDNPFRLAHAGRQWRCSSALLPAGIELELYEVDGLVGVCYLDPFNEDYRRLTERFRLTDSALLLDYAHEAELIQGLRELHGRQADPERVAGFLDDLIGTQPLPGARAPDARILQAVALIKADVGSNLSADYLARQVGLSVPRLSQLFRETLGISMRRYRQWHRLFVTTCAVARGQSLTHAALEAGFTDSAHFSHTFRSILGMSPSEMLRQAGGVRLFAGQ